ncbi:MAG: cysteine--tRNA ligase [Chloroflexi bacterium]|nr:cysteine--tRNA ligase [Chloroflexota bacterium]
MSLQIYNSLSRRKEPFEPIEPGKVRLYVCGVTVYDRSHTGHAMSALVFDMVRRYLEYRGYAVRHVVNFTDVDDKIIRRCAEAGISAFELADRYAREYLDDMARMGVQPATLYPRVSSEIPAIVAMIGELIEGGHAYRAPNGDVYFDARSFPGYGKLSGRSLDELESGEEPSEAKRHPADFALWKAARPGDPWWEAPWGRGRPGWHIECSAMARAHLGDRIDIHGGGNDLIFPHHENEIAQSESARGVAPFARYWMHNGMLQFPSGGSGVDKMSKSLGNVVPIGDFLDAHEADAFRLFVLSSHYRRPVTLTDEALAAAEKGLERLRGALAPARPAAGEGATAAEAELAAAAARARTDFLREMDDDFGTPAAIAALFELGKALNRARDAGAGVDALAAAQADLIELAGAIGFDLAGGARPAETDAGAADRATPLVELLLELRGMARAERQWAMADRIRDRMAELGIEVVDTSEGSTWRWA